MSQREGMKFESSLKSDCAALAGLTSRLLEQTDGVKFMRDPTRGGLAATLNEISRATGLSIEITEADIPINSTVQAAADMLGFDVVTIANEGKFVAFVDRKSATKILKIIKSHKLGRNAAIIGEVVGEPKGVWLKTKIGGTHPLLQLEAEGLPRIC